MEKENKKINVRIKKDLAERWENKKEAKNAILKLRWQ